MTSLWLDRSPVTLPASVLPGTRFDHLIVGGGLTGLVTAALLARAGGSVAVLEARSIGACATGNTTGKISLLQGTRLSAIARKHSAATVRAYVEANREGQQWLLRFCDENGVAYERRPAVTYAATPAGTRSVRAEFDACRRARLDVEYTDQAALPFQTFGAVTLPDQAQLDPIPVLEALIADACAHGAVVVEQTRVRAVRSAGRDLAVVTDTGRVVAGDVVLATGTPILDRGGFFARLEPNRSYALAVRVPGPLPTGMYLSADAPTRSLRTAGDLLLVGGEGHPVGRAASPQAHVAELLEWTQKHFPGAELTHRWSAQDYAPIGELPYAGPLLPGNDKIFVATGYAKWGLTNGVAAALAVSGRILGGQHPWAKAMASWSPRELVGVGTGASANTKVAYHLARGWAETALSGTDRIPAEGDGYVRREGTRPVGVCTVDGRTTRVSAICPHLYGILQWNDADRSWDCPLHGSRFSATGDLLEGPATTALR